jgi:hypothetical protein
MPVLTIHILILMAFSFDFFTVHLELSLASMFPKSFPWPNVQAQLWSCLHWGTLCAASKHFYHVLFHD